MEKILQQLSKVCTTCDKEKNVTYFSRDNEKKDGIRSQCKSCERKQRDKRREDKCFDQTDRFPFDWILDKI